MLHKNVAFTLKKMYTATTTFYIFLNIILEIGNRKTKQEYTMQPWIIKIV